MEGKKSLPTVILDMMATVFQKNDEFLWCGSALNVVQVRDFNRKEVSALEYRRDFPRLWEEVAARPKSD